MMIRFFIPVLLLVMTAFGSVHAQVLMYGDMNLLNTGTYPSDPRIGATQNGLLPNVVTLASQSFPHSFPFSPAAGAFPGTDQIYTSSNQTATGDGYSQFPGRLAGPQVLTLDYSSLVPPGNNVQTLTLGIAADDFQFPTFSQPFTFTINGVANPTLASVINGLDQTGPRVQYLTIGIDPSILTLDNKLILSINQNGDGRDGWAVDFLTIGVSTIAVPEPGSLLLIAGTGLGGIITFRNRRRLKRFLKKV